MLLNKQLAHERLLYARALGGHPSIKELEQPFG
jgi:hypothetical protein